MSPEQLALPSVESLKFQMPMVNPRFRLGKSLDRAEEAEQRGLLQQMGKRLKAKWQKRVMASGLDRKEVNAQAVARNFYL
jgi:hypothetical protein